MDIFRNIENDTFGYGGIAGKQSKCQKRLQLMICSFTNRWYPGTFICQLFNCYTSETKKYICPSICNQVSIINEKYKSCYL